MSLINQFNGLGGTITSRESLNQIRIQAIQEGNTEIASRIAHLLLSYPDASQFELENDDYIIEPVPASFLHGLDYEQAPDEPQGLGRVSPTEVYDMITAKIVTMIEAANARDYKKTWEAKEYGSGYTIPFNFASKKRYRGVNVLMLTELEPLENPFFLTFKQVKDLKGTVKKGAKGFEVVYFTKIWKTEDKPKNLKFSSYDKTKVESFATENGIQNDLGVIPMLKYYHVYNGSDIEGIDFGLDKFKIGFINLEKPADEANRMPIPEAILKNYPKPQPTLKFGGNRAFYSPGKDLIQMPYLSDFETVQDYYRTLLHEYSHSTGASKRLSRDFSGSQGSKKYAFEELVAELGAIFLSAEAGIVWHNNKNHAAYLKGWNSVLTQIKDDNKFIMKASTAAQKIADYVLQFDANGDPLYFEDLKNVEPEKKTIPKLDEDQQKRMLEKFKKAAGKDKEIKTIKKGEELHYMQNNVKIASINKLGVITWHKKGITTALRNKIRKDAETIGTTSKDEKKTEIIAYAVVDNITAEVVATKKTIPEIMKYISENYNPKFHDLQPLVYEVENIGGKNKLTNKIDVSKYASDVKPNDKNKSTESVKKTVAKAKKTAAKKRIPKPKNTFEVAAISDILKLEKYKDLKPFQAKVLFEKFKNDTEASVELNGFEAKIFKETSYFYGSSYDGSYGEKIILEDLGKEFIASVLGRLDSLQNQKSNYALFQGLKVPVTENAETVFTDVPEENVLPGETAEVENFDYSKLDPTGNQGKAPTSSKYKTAADRERENQQPKQLYKITGDLSKFLGKIEIKPVQSLAVTLDSEEGGGKTHTFYQWANEFYKAGYKTIIWSLEEHASSGLATDKSKKYFGDDWDKIVVESEISGEAKEETYQRITESINDFDVIFIDSWAKLVELNTKANFDQDFRKKFNGKLFFVIFQRTSSGEMRGGSKGAFDGDVILKVEVDRDDFRNNFIYNHKNRYNDYMPISELKYSPFHQALLKEEEELVFSEEIERI
jgi:antirestriction protein ArdC